MNSCSVSIIIATYNSGKTLRAALRSVVEQIYQDWECIIVDGASSDDTLSIIEEYESLDNRIRHISEPDNGIYDAFNKGWKLANGEWIHYLGSDDKLTKDSFCEMMSSNNIEYSVISGAVFVEKIDGSIKLLKSCEWDGGHQGKLTRKKILEKYGGFDEQFQIVADYDLYTRLKKSGEKIKNFGGVVAYFASTGISQSFKTFLKKQKEIRLVDKKNRNKRFFDRTIRWYKGLLSLIYRNMTKYINNIKD